MLTTTSVKLELVPKFWNGTYRKGVDNSIAITFPAGLNSQWISSFRHKEFLADLGRYISEARLLAGTPLASLRLSADFQADLQRRFGQRAPELIHAFSETISKFCFQWIERRD